MNEKAIEEFRKLFKEEHGVNISYEDALKKGIELLCLFQVIYRPVDKEWKRKKGYANKKD